MSNLPDESQSRIPLRVAVTGHRDLRPQDEEALRAAVRESFGELQRRYPNTPISILSALAEGADRLVAGVGLECGFELVAVIPMPIPEYLRDFASQASLEEFESLRARAALTFELPLEPGITADGLRSDPASRAQQFLALGAFLVQQSQILVALWDGLEGRTGGTARVVEFNLKGLPQAYEPRSNTLDPPDRGPVLHIITPRQSCPEPAGSAYARHILEPEGGGRAYRDALGLLDQANADFARWESRARTEIEASKGFVLGSPPHPPLPKGSHPMLQTFALADVLASLYQRKRRRVIGGLLLAVLIAFGALELFDNLLMDLDPDPLLSIAVLLAYPIVLVAAFLIYRNAHRKRFHARYLDYRALAEGLRVQWFWNLAGVKAQVPDRYLRKQTGTLRWIRDAIRSLALPLHAAPASDAGLRFAYERWVLDQEAWFRRRMVADHRGAKRKGRLALGFYLGSLLLSLAVVGHDVSAVLGHPLPIPIWIRGSVFVLLTLALALSAAVEAYSERMAEAELAQQYGRMHELFARGRRALERCMASVPEQARDVLKDLGDEALQENGDWLLMHRSLDVEPPK